MAPAPPPSWSEPSKDAARQAAIGGNDAGGAVPAPHGDTVWTRARIALGSLIGSGAAVRDLSDLMGAVQRPVSTGRRIAVASARGGSGKSTVTALMGTVFASRRGDHVVAVDADPAVGTLAWRLGVAVPDPMAVIARRVLGPQGSTWVTLEGVLPRASSGLWVLPGGAEGEVDLARDATRSLSRLCGVSVLDTGGSIMSPVAVSVLGDAHAVVLVCPASADGVRSTCLTLDQLRRGAGAGAVGRVVVALNCVDVGARRAVHIPAALAALHERGVAVRQLPYDRHLAADGPIVANRISAATLRAVTDVCAVALGRAAPL